MDSALLSPPRPSHSYAPTSPTLQDSSTNENWNGQNTHEPLYGCIRHGVHTSPRRAHLHISRLSQHILRNTPERRSYTREQTISSQVSTRESAGSGILPRASFVQISQHPASCLPQWSDGQPGSRSMSGRRSAQELTDGRSDSQRKWSFSAISRDKYVRRRLITLIISGIFLVLVLALYLAFAASDSHLGSELHILLIFMILILAIVLSHSLIRFSLAVLRGFRAVDASRIPNRIGSNGYAQLERPIHVTLAGDEEILAENNGSIRKQVSVPPPAYGLWRSSVRINPDLLYWQRINGNANPFPQIPSPVEGNVNKLSSPRPPSYTSDNGIDYVIGAQPRSFAEWPAPEESGRQ